jgi:type IV pilus biogenesis protein CpaD/CtpE
MQVTAPFILAAVAVALLAGCAKSSGAHDAKVTEQWLGRWNGPEGTYLDITGAPADYRLTIANLDGPRRFVGRAQGAKIVFVRDGLVESIRATDGEATGMKWLQDKQNCLTVRSGEGYCRD